MSVQGEGLDLEPVGQLDLEPIRVRLEALRTARAAKGTVTTALACWLSQGDVPELLAECERLRLAVEFFRGEDEIGREMVGKLSGVAREFIAYYTARDGNTGCSNCGGIPHSTTCFVALFQRALGPS